MNTDSILDYREEASSFEAAGIRFPAVLTLPRQHQNPWGIVLIPGSMANDVDGNYPSAGMHPHMYADLARQLAKQGYNVLRYARHGDDTGTTVINEEQAMAHRVFPQQQHIAIGACQKIRELVPHLQKLALAGHSEGSVHGMLLAQRPELSIDAFISLSGPAYRYLDLFIQMARKLSAEQGEIIDFGSFKVNAANYIRAFELLRENSPLSDEIKADPTMTFLVNSWDGDTLQAQQSRQYMHDYDAIDPYQEIAQIPCPVLIIQGGRDGSGVIAENGERLHQARLATHRNTTALAFFPELQHFYKYAEPDLNSYESMQLDSETDARVSQAINSWLTLHS